MDTDKLIHSLFFILEGCLLLWAFFYTTKVTISVKRVLGYFFIVVCPVILIFLFFGQWYGIVYFLASTFIFYYLLSKKIFTFIHICFVLIIGVFLDHLTQIILNFFKIHINPELIGHYILFSILFVLAIFVYNQATGKMYKLIGGVKIASHLILTIGLFTTITFYMNIYLVRHLTEDKIVEYNIITQLIYFSFMLIVIYFIIKIIKKENALKQKELETAQFNDYMHSLEIINNDMQKFQHDYSNILFTMNGYIENDDLEGLKQYFNQHIISTEEGTLRLNKRLSNLSKLHIPGMKGLLSTKILQAENEGITVNVEIPDIIDSIEMKVVDIARVLGIILDNAIEANKNTKHQKEISLAIFKSIEQSTIIVVENTYNDNIVHIDQLFNEGYSTKGNNRGIGLSNVKDIMSKYPNATLQTSINNGYFSQMIELAKG